MRTKPYTLTRLIIGAAVILGITWSCQTDENINPAQEEALLSENQIDVMTKLGKKLQNPYSVENMKKALEGLKSEEAQARFAIEMPDITTTHLYVRFEPKDEYELALLKQDSSLILYDHPLDYEIEEGGSFYRDPAVPLGRPTYQYVSLPVNKRLPRAVEYQVLDELFIPDDYGDFYGKIAAFRMENPAFVEALVDEALSITGNREDSSSMNNARASSWRPAGRIRVWDDSSSPNTWKPVEGVEVKARRWFTTHTGRTNSQGYFSCNGTFKREANYKIDWERYDFALREGWLDGANINGPKKEGDWNLDLNSGRNMFHARIFMAAYHYYYKDIKGLRRPPINGTLKTQMHIRCYNESNDDVNGNHKEERRFLGLGSQIKIYNPQNSMRSLYATTIHELGHASHWNMWRDGNDFDNSDKIVKETWAKGVEWELTRMVWSNYTPWYGRKKGGSSDPYFYYTGIVQDMVDGPSGYDQVSGYSIRQIEDALRSKKTWNQWKDNLKNSYENSTETQLDNLFTYWGI